MLILINSILLRGSSARSLIYYTSSGKKIQQEENHPQVLKHYHTLQFSP